MSRLAGAADGRVCRRDGGAPRLVETPSDLPQRFPNVRVGVGVVDVQPPEHGDQVPLGKRLGEAARVATRPTAHRGHGLSSC